MTLFDDNSSSIEQSNKKEENNLDRLKNLEEKIAIAVEKVKALKDEKMRLEKRIKELEMLLDQKNQQITELSTEKASIRTQVEDLLNELESLEI